MQCWIKVSAIGAAACIRPIQETDPRPLTSKRSLLYFDFSGWYNFGKIIKTVATRCHFLKLKCTKFDFGWGSAPDPAGGENSARLVPLAGFNRAYF